MRGGSWNHRAHEPRVSYRGFSSNTVIAVGSGYGFRCVVDFPKLNPEGKVWDGNWQPEPLPISPLSTSTWCPLPPNCASKRLKSCV